jgi:tetratricopeptide (TPR) repeat protein
MEINQKNDSKYLENYVKKAEQKEKKKIKLMFIYSLIPFFLVVILIIFSLGKLNDIQGKLELEKAKLGLSKDEFKKIEVDLTAIRNQLIKSRGAVKFVYIGLNHFHSKNYSAAIDAYSRAIELDSQNPVFFDYRGYAYFKRKEYGKAIESLEKSVLIDPEYGWGYYNLSLAYWAAGERDKSINTIRKVIELNPDFKKVIKKDGQFYRFKVSPKFLELIE